MQSAVRRILYSPRTFIWSAALGLLAVAVFVYLLDSRMQRFEGMFPGRELRDLLAPLAAATNLPAGLRFWLADFSWSVAAALFTAEMTAGTRLRDSLRAALMLLAATGWELLQALDVTTGVFDPVDLTVSAVAAVIAWIAYRIFIAGDTAGDRITNVMRGASS